jgi:hypothetical protein
MAKNPYIFRHFAKVKYKCFVNTIAIILRLNTIESIKLKPPVTFFVVFFILKKMRTDLYRIRGMRSAFSLKAGSVVAAKEDSNKAQFPRWTTSWQSWRRTWRACRAPSSSYSSSSGNTRISCFSKVRKDAFKRSQFRARCPPAVTPRPPPLLILLSNPFTMLPT